MEPKPETIMAILSIAHETSMRGQGLSLCEAMSRSGYREAPGLFAARDLAPVIREHQEFVEHWLAYSEDKRTSGGWYVTRAGEIGRVGVPDSHESFGAIEDAVAEYVIRELDYWAAV
jgi:hypothetical protein